MHSTPVTGQATRTGYSRPSLLRHDGPCGTRSECWRPDCRAAFGDYGTVEDFGWRVIAYCHGSIYFGADDPALAADQRRKDVA